MIRSLITILLILTLGIEPTIAAAPNEPNKTTSTQSNEQTSEAAEEDVDPNQGILDKAKDTTSKIEILRAGFDKLRRQIDVAKGDNKIALELQFQQKAMAVFDLVFNLSDILQKQGQRGIDTAELRDTVVGYVIASNNALDLVLEIELEKNISKRSQTADLKGFELIEFERFISDDMEWIETLFKKKIRIIRELERLGLDVANARENLLNRLVPYADNLYGQITVIARQKHSLELSMKNEKPSADLRSEILAMKTREAATLGALSSIVVMMDEFDIESTRYRQLLLQTGEVSTDLFNPTIVLGILQKQTKELLESGRDNTGYFLTKTILFLAILGIFKLIARLATYLMRRSFESKKVETSRLMQEMLLSLSNRGIMIFGLLIALSQLGVEITAFLTGIGIAGFIVGFALQDSLANFAAGIMILGYRPFDVDDIIEAGGVIGKVSKMSLVSTTVLTFDNQTLIIPNNRIWGDVIKNITLQDNRRIDMEFRVAYGEDIERVKGIIEAIIIGHDRILENPAPTIEMDQLSPFAMVFVVRPWVLRADYWPTRWELLRVIKEELDSNNVQIPVLNQGAIATP